MSDVQIAVVDQQDTQIVLAVPGVQGATGSEIPTGGTVDQVLRKSSSTNYDTNWSQVTSAMIADGTIVNADINASAAIAGTKISPDFGSQTVQTTGIFSAAGGSAAAPSIAFTGDTNTGIYSPGADQVAISTSGVGRLLVDSSGNLIQYSETTLERQHRQQAASAYTATNIKSVIDGATGYLTFETGSNWTNGNAVERLRITSGGLVGVGTSSPNYQLHVTTDFAVGASGFNQQLTFSNDTIQSLLLGTGYTALKLNPLGGNVGIGTSAPASILDAAGDVSITGNENYLYLYSTYIVGSNSRVRMRAVGAGGGSGFGGDFRLSTRKSDNTWNTDAFVVSENGLVGIGTTSPNSVLQVNSGTNLGGILVGFNAGSSNFYDADLQVFRTGNGTERARIDSSGRLLVGTSSALSGPYWSNLANLQVAGSYGVGHFATFVDSTSGAGLVFQKSRNASVGGNTIVSNNDLLMDISIEGNDGTGFKQAAVIQCQVDGTPGANDMPGRLVFSTTADGASSPTERVRISSDGSLYIGGTISTLATNTISSAYAGDTGRWVYNGKSTVSVLDINQTFDDTNARNAIRFYRNETEVGSVSVSTTATSYNTSSDYRLKENVTAVTDGITRLQQLKPSRFSFIADPAKTVDGFLAHEVQTVVPEAITGEKDAVDDEGNPVYQGIDQSKLVPLLTAALQEAIGEIESLKARVAALEAN